VLSGLTLVQVALLLLAGVLLDVLLGEARRWHPLVGFGNLASRIERFANRGEWRILRGVLAWSLAVLPLTALALFALLAIRACGAGALTGLAIHALLLYFAIGLRSLREHNLPIAAALERDDLPAARALTARIVSRDTANAGPTDLAKASTESLLENGNDAVFGALFWFAVAGGPGVLLFRLANTLDAMWGYRTERFNLFGRFAARIDDVLNYLPARLTALSYVILADHPRRAWRCWRAQAPAWSSPNAGSVMSTGAGALGLALGGAAIYDGVEEVRPVLGYGVAPEGEDIRRAWRLVRATTLLWLGVIGLAGALYA
jgi:adenosylcobinamide-phosphate synthase